MRASTIVKRILEPTQSVEHTNGAPPSITIRYARSDEADAIAELAALDSSRAPRGVVIVAEVAGEIWAAISVDDLHGVSDPFRPSGELAFLLAARARQLRLAEFGRMERLPRVWPATPLSA